MAELTETLKSLMLKVLPDRLLFEIKKMHYLRHVRAFPVPEARVIRALVKPGDHVLDIGANVGWYSKVLSGLVGSSGRVYSLEPVPSTFKLLRYCVKKLGLRNVETIECAMSDRTGLATMEVPVYRWGGDNFYEAEIVEDGGEQSQLRRFTVRVDTVDSLFHNVPAEITFIKVDVEGHEVAVLRGATRVLSRTRPPLLLEMGGNPDDDKSSARTLIVYLRDHEYSPYWFDGERLRLWRTGDPLMNHFFLTARHVERVTALGLSVC
jgi:FkbM family methyltransferase